MKKRYQLYVNVDGYWELVRGIDAMDHPSALREAASVLQGEYRDKPIRLEQDCDSPIQHLPELVWQ